MRWEAETSFHAIKHLNLTPAIVSIPSGSVQIRYQFPIIIPGSGLTG